MSNNKNKSSAVMLLAIFFAVFLATLGMSTVNIALAVFIKHFNTDLNTANWTVTGFLLAAGVIAPLSGFLGQKFGNKAVCFYSILGLVLSSLLCAVSWNISSLIAFRVLQGIFSGIIAPVTMTIIYQSIEKEKQAFAISLWGLAATLVPAFGPTLSGWLIDKFNWQAIFLINIPLGILTAIIVKFFIPDYKMEGSSRFDLIGTITSITASILLLITFSESSRWGWASFRTIGLIVVGLAVLAIFILWERHFDFPLLNLSVFKYRRYTVSIIIGSIITVALYSGALLTPLFLQNVQQVTALKAGLILLPASLIMALIMPLIGKLYNYAGPRVLILTGILLIALGSWKIAHLTINTSASYIVFWMLVRGIGTSLSMVPATNAGMEVIPAELSGSASSVSNWVRQGLACLSIGVFTAMLTARTAFHAQNLAVENPNDRFIAPESFTQAVNDVFLMSTIIIIIAIPLSLYLKKMSRDTKTEG